ncbi:hypothetical protein [Flectobacillus sp. BAB-3569]|uniref:hypothetical protein n=1 Tax=Flectobacillus sp. BAB-3569 TaxID=1509483 RepID=UPI000BA2D71B|nr:hypothetical protein [Flectobacillus sp. BAB-3569]PAC27768.1 hypothetical protein BWI92_21385 [Flectobacillus sp. BAB-3569]
MKEKKFQVYKEGNETFIKFITQDIVFKVYESSSYDEFKTLIDGKPIYVLPNQLLGFEVIENKEFVTERVIKRLLSWYFYSFLQKGR